MTSEEWVEFSIQHGLHGLLAISMADDHNDRNIFIRGRKGFRPQDKDWQIAESYFELSTEVFAQLGWSDCHVAKMLHLPWDEILGKPERSFPGGRMVVLAPIDCEFIDENE
jgi:hypothetical protein